ncbi:h-sco1 [Flagelloscypha sp. PMI_526]|nr:h-sco1 [Flagelloscypha sp. PMI_526]
MSSLLRPCRSLLRQSIHKQPTRTFSSSHSRLKSSGFPRKSSSELEYKEKSQLGVFTPLSAGIFVSTGLALWAYFHYEKQRIQEEKKKSREERQYGRPDVGGPFVMQRVTHHGNLESFSELDLLGKWNFVYFGFTNCPDICPAELDKITAVLNDLQGPLPTTPFQPIFISVDPARDTPSSIRRYLADFHSAFTGLVGSFEDTKAICRKYRVYFSTPKDADPKGDYLVDHSIFIYLMDPEGKFADAFGQTVTKEEMVEKVQKYVKEFNATQKQ